jgi:hypothetical protein
VVPLFLHLRWVNDFALRGVVLWVKEVEKRFIHPI